jgi:hypothetical protein
VRGPERLDPRVRIAIAFQVKGDCFADLGEQPTLPKSWYPEEMLHRAKGSITKFSAVPSVDRRIRYSVREEEGALPPALQRLWL